MEARLSETTAGQILLFLKYPSPGAVKSRLARDIGNDAACALYRAFVDDLLAMLDGVEQSSIICHYPADAGELMRDWLGKRRYLPQQGRDLGERMENAVREAFADGATKVVLIGSDIPALTARHLSDAFTSLATHDAALGPAVDGGYYLLGLTRSGFTPALFHDIAWSTPTVLTTTMARLAADGRSVAMLDELRDIDTFRDLAELAGDIRSGRVAAPATAARLADFATALCLPSPL